MESSFPPTTTARTAPYTMGLGERLRKNSLHDKTQRGADVGDAFMTVIETCRAHVVNPFDSMLAVVKNAEAAGQDPGKWMPWNAPRNQDLSEPSPATPA